jgi:hypothetical protein
MDLKSGQITNFDGPYKKGYSGEYTTALGYPEASIQYPTLRDVTGINHIS